MNEVFWEKSEYLQRVEIENFIRGTRLERSTLKSFVAGFISAFRLLTITFFTILRMKDHLFHHDRPNLKTGQKSKLPPAQF